MYRLRLSVDIAAPKARVWRALCDPNEVVRWDAGVDRALDAPPDYPRPGQHVRWRHRAGPFRVLHDRPLEVAPEEKLRSLLALGPYRYDETYRLERLDAGCRLTVEVNMWVPVPILGPVVERLYLGPATRRALAVALTSIKRHCETTP